MALFKPFRGNRATLDAQPLHDGYAYFCIDDGSFHIDYINADGNLQRKQINAANAETLCGMTLDELKAYFATNAGGGAIPDWSQNDDTQPDYIKNRTHYKEENFVVTEILPEATLTMLDLDDDGVGDAYVLDHLIDIEANKTYVVNWRGTEYTCTSIELDPDGDGATSIYLGDIYTMSGGTIGDASTGEPFVIALDQGIVGFIDLAGNTDPLTVSISAREDASIYHKLDKNYIPDEVINDLPKWIRGTKVEILPETTLEPTDGQAIITNTLNLITNETYTVRYNGVEYTTTAIEMVDNGLKVIILGDVYTMSGGTMGSASTGEPFVLMYAPEAFSADGYTGVVAPLDGATTITLRIIGGKDESYIEPSQVKDMYYEEGGEIYLTASYSSEEIAASEGMLPIISMTPLTIGETYTVNWNGVEYTCVGEMYDEDGMSGVVLGNLGAITGGASTGEPFIIISIAPQYIAEFGAAGAIIPLDGSQVVDVSIYNKGIVHTVPMKYLPEHLHFGEPNHTLIISGDLTEKIDQWYFVCNDTPTIKEVNFGGNFKFFNKLDDTLFFIPIVGGEQIQDGVFGIQINVNDNIISEYLIVVQEDGVQGFIKKGIYINQLFISDFFENISLTLNGYAFEYSKIDEKYLPDSLGSSNLTITNATADDIQAIF